MSNCLVTNSDSFRKSRKLEVHRTSTLEQLSACARKTPGVRRHVRTQPSVLGADLEFELPTASSDGCDHAI